MFNRDKTTPWYFWLLGLDLGRKHKRKQHQENWDEERNRLIAYLKFLPMEPDVVPAQDLIPPAYLQSLELQNAQISPLFSNVPRPDSVLVPHSLP